MVARDDFRVVLEQRNSHYSNLTTDRPDEQCVSFGRKSTMAIMNLRD